MATESASALVVTPSHEAIVGRMTVRRALPQPRLRTVGAWCFADHMGPLGVTAEQGLNVGPHPHMGLQTVTWLIEGSALHRDSLGSEQLISAGQLNLMTAGQGVSHSEEATGSYEGELEGIQLWIAQPEATRGGPAAFEHHAELPTIDLDGGEAIVLIGEQGGLRSPARHDTALVGLELSLRSASLLELRSDFEHALVVLRGDVTVDGQLLRPGHLGYLGVGHEELAIDPGDGARVMLIGGAPLEETIEMWWNFVGRSRDEFVDAYRSWAADDGRFGRVASLMPRVETEAPRPLGRPLSSGSGATGDEGAER